MAIPSHPPGQAAGSSSSVLTFAPDMLNIPQLLSGFKRSIHRASNGLSSQPKEIFGVQRGLDWFRFNTPRLPRENALLSQTNMLIRVPKFQLELFRHPL